MPGPSIGAVQRGNDLHGRPLAAALAHRHDASADVEGPDDVAPHLTAKGRTGNTLTTSFAPPARQAANAGAERLPH